MYESTYVDFIPDVRTKCDRIHSRIPSTSIRYTIVVTNNHFPVTRYSSTTAAAAAACSLPVVQHPSVALEPRR